MSRGDFALIMGFDNVGKLIRIGEALNGDGWNSIYSHAVMIVSDDPDPAIIEAEPGGARLNRLSAYGHNSVMSSWQLTEKDRTMLVECAYLTLHVPYSFLDYGSLALARFHIRPPFVKNYVANTGHMICSQLVDYVYTRAGLNMFNDHRIPGDVTPQDLASVLKGPQR